MFAYIREGLTLRMCNVTFVCFKIFLLILSEIQNSYYISRRIVLSLLLKSLEFYIISIFNKTDYRFQSVLSLHLMSTFSFIPWAYFCVTTLLHIRSAFLLLYIHTYNANLFLHHCLLIAFPVLQSTFFSHYFPLLIAFILYLCSIRLVQK